ncbi:MAG: type II toxin-antitoxin system HicA family toxin [Chloroflexota bacterium]|nr:type II toxin-antitoxin system HicA family toxin [Chloroflexota bacterium]
MRYGPIKRRDLIEGMKKFGFSDPIRPRKGSDHDFMVKDERRVKIPNGHQQQDISIQLLSDILKQAGISRNEWERT